MDESLGASPAAKTSSALTRRYSPRAPRNAWLLTLQLTCSRIFPERYYPVKRGRGLYALRGFCYSTIFGAVPWGAYFVR